MSEEFSEQSNSQQTNNTSQTSANSNSVIKVTKQNCNVLWKIISLVSLLGVIALFIFTFGCKKACTTNEKESAKPKTAVSGSFESITIAYINTDTIIKNYLYAKDLEKELQTLQKNAELNFQSKATALQADFQNYLKTGSSLTLSEQKKKEESFKQREAEIGQLQQRMVMEIQQKQVAENTKLINAIYAFIRKYNEENQQYTVIFKKSFLESPVLYIDENLDLTNEILEGLNKEYAEVKADK